MRHYVSIYTSIWYNHGRTRLVLVSFPAKEFGSLALKVVLAEPPLGAMLMASKPSTIQFINLVISWFYVVASLCWTTNTWKSSTIAKNYLNNFLTFGASSSFISSDSSTTKRYWVCLPPFCLGTPKRAIKEFMSPLDSKEWKLMCSFDSTIGLGIFSFPFYFWGHIWTYKMGLKINIISLEGKNKIKI